MKCENRDAKAARTNDTCARCGGDLPAPHGSAALDALDVYLVRDDADCPAHVRTDASGQVLGCGAWTADAYAHYPTAEETDD